ncbi:DUF5808 domain-containing protein [Pedobacter sp. N23S346]|uniref:DUF5808 domain-containing protein n=1 Tax=Pedobacter sp. N23S346 TaxID=3402750 RepID=UPI003ACE92D7
MIKDDSEQKSKANWKLGIFYFNKNDSRLFVPKRIKILGWTLNFANPLSYLIIILIIVFSMIINSKS